jgi:hypothetical protein
MPWLQPEGPREWRPFQFSAPNLSDVIAAQIRSRDKQTEQVQESIKGIGEMMQKRKQDEIASAMADQLAGAYGVDLGPKTGAYGEGVMRLKMVDEMYKAKKLAPLEEDVLRARAEASRRGPVTAGGGGAGVPGGVKVETLPTGERYVRGPRGGIHWLKPEEKPGEVSGKPMTAYQQQTRLDKLHAAEAALLQRSQAEEDYHRKMNRPGVPFSGAAELARVRAEIAKGEGRATGGGTTQPESIIPNTEAPKGGASGSTTTISPPAGGQPSAGGTDSDSARARARQALADPNASEEAKRAARQILGE